MVGEFGRTQYAKRAGRAIAYRTSENGARVVIAQMPAFYPMAVADEPYGRYWYRRLAEMGRAAIFDRVGVGESDPIDLADPPTLDDLADDTIAIIDALGADDATLLALYDVVPVAVNVAVRHPERVSALVLVQGFVSWAPTEDLPQGMAREYNESYEDAVERGVESGLDITALVAPSAANDIRFREWFEALGRRGASPSSALAITKSQRSWDVRRALTEVSCPTLILHRAGNRFVPIEQSQYAAARIPHALLVELGGADQVPFVGDQDELLDKIEEFVAGRRGGQRNRALAAVLFTDIVGSTRLAAEQGDRTWQRTLERHDAVASRVISDHDGSIVKSTGDGLLAVFASAISATHAAAVLRDEFAKDGLQIRAGLHAGEIERVHDDVGGIAVNIAARVMARAGPDEIYVSAAVPLLVVGSDIRFQSRGTHELKGVPGRWELFEVTS